MSWISLWGDESAILAKRSARVLAKARGSHRQRPPRRLRRRAPPAARPPTPPRYWPRYVPTEPGGHGPAPPRRRRNRR
ncbi:hypothetical protein SGCZBJ_01485 [Caulobacter zeae]|uniref:Uncharacterized protein n=1 Tax=Caulobacter zeae TaxID=2055137 RepID=A0A2N5DRG4_9CAUL|nr:hypothetical protein SGCZBJ_01485 [Caulobacter zeae]